MKHLLSKTFLAALLLSPAIASAQDALFLRGGASLTLEPGSSLTIQGGVMSYLGSSILLNGNLFLTDNGIANHADWTDSTAAGVLATSGTGTVHFQSTSSQKIFGNTAFYNFYMEASGGVNLLGNLTVTDTLHLTTGVITTNSQYVILQNTDAAALAADPANPDFYRSWINGNLRQYVGATPASYSFGLGNASAGNKLVFVSEAGNPVTGINYLNVSFGPKPGPAGAIDLTEDGITYTTVNTQGVWYLEPDQTPTGGNYDLKLYFNGFSGLVDNQFAILRRPDNSTSDADWEIPPGSTIPTAGSPGRLVSDSFALRSGISTFSQYGIGMVNNPLPLALLSFAGAHGAGGNQLYWTTTREVDFDHFEIQRATVAAASFSNLGTLAGTGGTGGEINSYRFTDDAGLLPVDNYRLKMVDRNGAVSYSKIISIQDLQAGNTPMTVIPNPADGQVLLTWTSPDNSPADIRIIDSRGEVVLRYSQAQQAGVNQLIIPLNHLSRGVYTLARSGGGQSESTLFTKL